ncbi:MAG: hypothetical protein WCW61_01665 [Patescibacteria group bacterium]|jgi:hypothetical protein
MKKIKTAFLKLGQLFKRAFKRKLKMFQIFKRHPWLLIFPGLVILIIVYLLSALLLISPARIKLSEFQENVEAAGPCHEECLLARKQLKDELAAYFKQNKKFQIEVEKLFLANGGNNDAISLNLKKELLEIIAIGSGAANPPDFIADYFLSAGAHPELKAEIIKLFLASTASPDLADYYFSLLSSQEAMVVKTEAIKTLSSLPDKSIYFKIEEISQLKTLILQSEAPLSFKADLIFLLADFYEFFPAETELALSEILKYSSQNVIKAFTADALKNLGFMGVEVPNVTETEWAEYFNN